MSTASPRDPFTSKVSLRLEPLGVQLEVNLGTPLRDVLFPQGVEFPCGGLGRCKGCRVKVLDGHVHISSEDAARLSTDELDAGWRLACRARALGDLRIELAQWETTILGDDRDFRFQPQPGFGVAVDLGTTTLVAQLVDRRTGHVLAVQSALNDQARHGADIMTRVSFAMDGGAASLRKLIRHQVGSLICDLFSVVGLNRCPAIDDIVIVGNAAMHHLFCDIDVTPLAQHPFEPVDGGLKTFDQRALGWSIPGNALVHFLPCLGSFVGSDILAGILATGLHESDRPVALVDLGTNGEIAVGNRDRILCTSTAAGPAFEGARISHGMRAATGAICEVRIEGVALACRTVGDVPARGICGSGLVSAVAACLDLGIVLPNGRLRGGESIPLAGNVHLTQCDVRELQLAKGAIAAGLRLLATQWGTTVEGLHRVHLAGAFGNYLNLRSARRIGLLPVDPSRIAPAGNSALRGAKLALFELASERGEYRGILERVRHVPLNEDPDFQDVYVEEMGFPRYSE